VPELIEQKAANCSVLAVQARPGSPKPDDDRGRFEISAEEQRNVHSILYGLFYLGIDDKAAAANEFERAHNADRTNVFAMIKQANVLLDLAIETRLDGSDTYKEYLNSCASLVRKILEFDSDNVKGLDLMHSLHRHFNRDV
jgi:hypothetical protein